ncbi:MAG TPA: ATP-binding protein [Anaeromyxobacteraceae bacterium]|nr:ATP-binding protein [Anaeromyxobacteraceae bacterium]
MPAQRASGVATRPVLVVGLALVAYLAAVTGLALQLTGAVLASAGPRLAWYLGATVGGLVLLAGVAWAEIRHLHRTLERSREALDSSEERFRLAFKTSPEPLTLSRLDTGELVACNDGFLQLHGLTEAQAVGRRTVDLGLWVDPAERDAIAREVNRSGVVRARDVRVRGGAGDVRVLAFSASVVTMAGQRYMLALGRDVTEERAAAAARDRLAAALRESEARYRSVLRSVPVVQWAIGLDDRFTLSEGQGLAALGLAPGEVVGRSVFDVYGNQPGVLADYRRARAGESFVTLNDLGPVVFESHWGPMLDDAGAVVGVTGIALDVSDRRKAEGQLLQAQKMEAVGRLASGIAHDFNNLLVVILGGSEHLRAHPGADPDVRSTAGEIAEAGQRAATLVRQLLAFGRKSRAEPRACTLNGVVDGFEKLLRRTIGEQIAIEMTLAERPWTVRLDPQQIEQVILNLAVNARDAMPEGGTLRIATANVGPGAAAGGGGRWASLAVSDTGKGMSPEVRAHLFEPFFTTKGPRGTGLGLATVFGIVQQAGGRIEVDSEPGRGTTFTLLFPAVEGALHVPEAEAEAPGPETVGAGQRVLVVEDEPTVRRSTARMLRECGFEAVEVERPEDALRQVEDGAVDAVLTDVVMPGMTGAELARRLEALRPGIPVVFATGYMDRRAHQLAAGAIVLEKPFTRAAVAERVARALAARRTGGGEPGGR